MINRNAVLSILQKHKQELNKNYYVASLSLFGSFARDEANLNSDIDLLVEFEQPVGLFEFIELQQYLESILGRKVDLGTLRSLKDRIKPQIKKEMIRVP